MRAVMGCFGDRVVSKAVCEPDQSYGLVKSLRDVLAGLGLTSHNKTELKRRRHRRSSCVFRRAELPARDGLFRSLTVGPADRVLRISPPLTTAAAFAE